MNRLPALILGVLTVTTAGCQPSEKVPELPVITDANQAIAEIGDLKITGQDLNKEIISSMTPNPRHFRPDAQDVEAQVELMKLLGDRALVLDARQQGLLNEGSAPKRIKRFRQDKLVEALAFTIVPSLPEVTDDEVAAYLEKNRKGTPERAKAQLANRKRAQIMDEFYQGMAKTRNFKVFPRACATGAEIYERLLNKPGKSKTQFWVQNNQFDEEVTSEQKRSVLAEWDGGQFTLADYFETLSRVSPPSRPKNLITAKGFEAFLARMIRKPVLETEALSRRLDQRPDMIQTMRSYEDQVLMSMIRSRVTKEIAEPNEGELRGYYNLTIGQEDLMTRIKVDMIWCETREVAQKALADLKAGTDFNDVQGTCTLAKKNRAQQVTPQSMGIFWQALQGSKVGEVVGPLPGQYQRQFAWRLMRVKEIEKRDYPTFEQVKTHLEGEIHEARMDQKLDQMRSELLAKIPYKILTAKPEVFDPRYVEETAH